MPRAPHKLDLYRLGVQHPEAEAAFLARVYAHYRHGRQAMLLKEDFAGGAALATAWVADHEDRRALGVERHGPTAHWAARRAAALLGSRAGDLHVLCADVMDVSSPRVDIVAALNFSAFIYHGRDALRSYFRAARRSLRPEGILVVDAYGGPGAWRVGRQERRVTPPPASTDQVKPFDYIWEQRACDALTGKVDCRIHFRLPRGRLMRSAFRYDWRLWSLPELRELMGEAGFEHVAVWCDRLAPATRSTRRPHSDGLYRPVRHMEAREDWVAYVVGLR